MYVGTNIRALIRAIKDTKARAYMRRGRVISGIAIRSIKVLIPWARYQHFFFAYFPNGIFASFYFICLMDLFTLIQRVLIKDKDLSFRNSLDVTFIIN